MNGATGLDYVAVDLLANAFGIRLADVLPYLQLLEADQTAEWREKSEKKES